MSQNIREEIQSLEKISAELEPNQDQLASYISQIHSFSKDFLNEIPHKKAWNSELTNDLSSLNLSQDSNLQNLLSSYKKKVIEEGLSPASGGHLGYIPGGGIYLASIGDYIAALTNEYAGMHYPSPGGSVIENNLINWMKELFGFPKSSVGNLASGGSIANLIAITAARDAAKLKGEKIEKSVVYCNQHLHHCMLKAFRIAGLEDVIIRNVDLDENHSLKINHLKELLKEDKERGLEPFMLVGNAGTTDTGSIDPLEEMAIVAKNDNMWFHVDAAYGGFFQLTNKGKQLLKGIDLADSLVVDPHKGMFLPYGLGAVLIKNVEAVLCSNRFVANYMLDAFEEDTVYNSADLSPELSKHFRGMRMWVPLKMLGTEPFRACLDEKLLLIQYLYDKMKTKGYQMGPKPSLTVTYFNWNFVEDLAQNNALNKQWLEEILKDGRIFLSSTIINDKFVIRVAILSFRTKLETIDLCLEVVEASRKKVLQLVEEQKIKRLI